METMGGSVDLWVNSKNRLHFDPSEAFISEENQQGSSLLFSFWIGIQYQINETTSGELLFFGISVDSLQRMRHNLTS